MGKTKDEFIEDIFDIAFGETKLKDELLKERDYETVTEKIMEFSDNALKWEEGEDQAEQLGKKIYSGQFFDKKSDMIVCYTRCFYGEHERHTSSDYIEAFRKENKRAFARYEELLKENDIYSASICAVINSTDYDGEISR